MRSIEGSLTQDIAKYVGGMSADHGEAFAVSTYRQLVEQVAQLAYLNKDYMLFFRGQKRDYKNKAGASTFYPSIYRGDYLPQQEVKYRFEILYQASKQLIDRFINEKIEGNKEVKRKKYIQWSILQHYEVCATPLLDFTHSLRVACSFAQIDNESNQAYVFVFGLPYITNRITINSEHDLVNVRLLSICPPDALRPYFQDGYLAGTEDITSEYDSKTELDFKNRLIAKFRFPNNKKFWGQGFSKIPRSVLYPRNDKVRKLCQSIEIHLKTELQPGPIGEFLKEWSELESLLLDRARKYQDRAFSPLEAIKLLHKQKDISQDMMMEIDVIRRFRNKLVHQPKTIDLGEIYRFIESVKVLGTFLSKSILKSR